MQILATKSNSPGNIVVETDAAENTGNSSNPGRAGKFGHSESECTTAGCGGGWGTFTCCSAANCSLSASTTYFAGHVHVVRYQRR